MPELDGFEVCLRLREHSRLREIPIIMITSLDDQESRVRGLSVGADGFISKPCDSAELLAHVRTIMRLNRYRRLLSERERFQRLIELSPEGVAIVNAASTLLLVNPALGRLLDVDDAAGLVGQSLVAYIQPMMLDRYEASLDMLNGRPQ
ncbi:MAG: response regulator [Chloroflexi bacterium]|nr:response regulator [Chloroflexota bacterium]